MASKRQIKKQTKRELRLKALRRIEEIEKLKIDDLEIENEIKRLKKQIEMKKIKLQELRNRLNELNNLSETNLLHTFNKTMNINSILNAAEKAKGKGDSYNHAEHWAAIKRYNELVDLGIIPKGTVTDKYDAAEYLRNVMSDNELNAMVKAAEKKERVLWAKNATRNSDVIQFDF